MTAAPTLSSPTARSALTEACTVNKPERMPRVTGREDRTAAKRGADRSGRAGGAGALIS